MATSRDLSWHATGLVEKAWERINPPKRDELARRLGVAGSDLSQRNNSHAAAKRPRPMTMDYARRIVDAVQVDDPTFTLADLGAPASVVAEADPTVLDLLRELEATVATLKKTQDATLRRLRALERWRAALPPPAAASGGDA